MAKLFEIVKEIEKFAPIETAEDWDNPGFQINCGNKEIKKILVSLNVTKAVAKEAIKLECNAIISHHPLIFNMLERIDKPFVLDLIKNNISVYSAHTNLDKASGGSTEFIIQKCGYKNPQNYNDFIKFVDVSPIKIKDVIKTVKDNLDTPEAKFANPRHIHTVKRIAFCAGSGGSFISELKNSKIDLYVTGDVKYHEALDSHCAVLDIGHFGTEKHIAEIFKKILKDFDLEIIMADEEDIWKFV